jgi:hypothetical protein
MMQANGSALAILIIDDEANIRKTLFGRQKDIQQIA